MFWFIIGGKSENQQVPQVKWKHQLLKWNLWAVFVLNVSNLARYESLAGNNSQSTADFDECGLLFIQLVKLCWISIVNLFDVFFKRFILDLTFMLHTPAALYQQWCIWRHKSNSRFLFELSVVSFGAKFYKSMRGHRAWRMTVWQCWWLAVLRQVETLV